MELTLLRICIFLYVQLVHIFTCLLYSLLVETINLKDMLLCSHFRYQKFHKDTEQLCQT